MYLFFYSFFFLLLLMTNDYLGLSKSTKGAEREGKRVGAQDASRLEPGYVFFYY